MDARTGSMSITNRSVAPESPCSTRSNAWRACAPDSLPRADLDLLRGLIQLRAYHCKIPYIEGRQRLEVISKIPSLENPQDNVAPNAFGV